MRKFLIVCTLILSMGLGCNIVMASERLTKTLNQEKNMELKKNIELEN